jgi:hypothetical protein
VSADGNEADVAMTFIAAEVVGANDGETGVLALRSRVGLKRAAGKTGHLGEVVSEFLSGARGQTMSGEAVRTADERQSTPCSLEPDQREQRGESSRTHPS